MLSIRSLSIVEFLPCSQIGQSVVKGQKSVLSVYAFQAVSTLPAEPFDITLELGGGMCNISDGIGGHF